jgi:hypothetical protein
MLNDTLEANIRSRGLTPARKHCNSRLSSTGHTLPSLHLVCSRHSPLTRVQFAETGADGFQWGYRASRP